MSVCGTDSACASHEAFLGSMASTTSARNRPRHHLSGIRSADFPTLHPTGLNQDNWSPARLASSTPPWHRTHTHWYGNVDPFSIDYAFRPRLRFRLTLGGLTLPRKPWVYGDADSHCVSRYSCPHTHSDILQESLRSPFAGSSDAPLPRPARARAEQSRLRYHA